MAAMKRGARRKETGLKLGYGWIPDLPDHRDIKTNGSKRGLMTTIGLGLRIGISMRR